MFGICLYEEPVVLGKKHFLRIQVMRLALLGLHLHCCQLQYLVEADVSPKHGMICKLCHYTRPTPNNPDAREGSWENKRYRRMSNFPMIHHRLEQPVHPQVSQIKFDDLLPNCRHLSLAFSRTSMPICRKPEAASQKSASDKSSANKATASLHCPISCSASKQVDYPMWPRSNVLGVILCIRKGVAGEVVCNGTVALSTAASGLQQLSMLFQSFMKLLQKPAKTPHFRTDK